MAYKGYFRPKNPYKYSGNTSNIIYRSSWELKLMGYLDSHPDVVSWGSEEFCIPYKSPIDGKIHRYYPDFIIKKKSPAGKVETIVVEVKPKSQTTAPKTQKKLTKKYLNEVYTWGVNSAKWKFAKSFCDDRMWKFVIMTEDDLGIKI